MDIKSLRKVLLKKVFSYQKNKQQIKNSLYNIYKVSFASLLIIGFFYLLPPSHKFLTKLLKPNLEIENSSNKKLALVLDGKSIDQELNDEK